MKMKGSALARLALLCTPWCLAAQSPAEPKLVTRSIDGGVLYRAHCGVCHGAGATGNGAMASALRTAPPDLTQLARRNKGVFPIDRVQQIIEGGAGVKSVISHGTSEMPVWGPVFSSDMGERDLGKLRIFNLARYIEKLQK